MYKLNRIVKLQRDESLIRPYLSVALADLRVLCCKQTHSTDQRGSTILVFLPL